MSRRNPVLFLDFDGVLNAGCGKIERRLVRRVAAIVEATDARVVLSTTWREHHPLSELRQILHDRGLSRTRVIDGTPILHRGTRGQEIAQWLGDQRVRFAVLDDNDAGPFDMRPVRRHLVRTQIPHGMTWDDGARVQELLTKGPYWSWIEEQAS